jgi:hypothetical protein
VVGRVTKVEMTFFILVEGGSGAVQGGWPTAVVQFLKCFGFGSRREATGRSFPAR